MADIKECELCGKRTDFWTELIGQTAEGNRMQKNWRLITCQSCAETESITGAMTAASDHVTQRCHDEGKA